MTKSVSILLTILFFNLSSAQVGIGTATPSPSSALDIKSSNSGLLIPRVSLNSTTDVTTIASPETSLLVYNLNNGGDVTPGFYYWDGSWKTLKGTSSTSTTVSGGWSLNGNTLSSGTEYLGTNSYNSLLFKVNSKDYGKFHPNGGLAIGLNSSANDNSAIAIGTDTKSSNNNGISIGNKSQTSGQESTALGTESNSSGQRATAIGYQATATQANSIILGKVNGSDEWSNPKVGIGTNTPDERLHIAGSIKIVDGTQGIGKVLTSDANGKASWVNPGVAKSYADIYYNGLSPVPTLSQYESVKFGATNASSNITVDTSNKNNIQVLKTGKYKITYRITLSKSTVGPLSVTYNLYNGYNTIIPGSLANGIVDKDKPVTITASVIANVDINSQIQVRSLESSGDVTFVVNGCSLSVELID